MYFLLVGSRAPAPVAVAERQQQTGRVTLLSGEKHFSNSEGELQQLGEIGALSKLGGKNKDITCSTFILQRLSYSRINKKHIRFSPLHDVWQALNVSLPASIQRRGGRTKANTGCSAWPCSSPWQGCPRIWTRSCRPGTRGWRRPQCSSDSQRWQFFLAASHVKMVCEPHRPRITLYAFLS